MGLFSKFKKSESVEVVEVKDGYQSFSTPFLKVPNTDLSLPYIDSRNNGGQFVYFGETNLYPQLLTQIYYSSPLHGSIVNYKTNATVGGGFSFDEKKLTAKNKVDLYSFTKKIDIDKALKRITKDLIIHERIYYILDLKGGELKSIKYLSPEKVRINLNKTMYSVSTNWLYRNDVWTIEPYHPTCTDGRYLFCYELDSVGQDTYPIPQYTSALNFAFLSGELSYLAKANIQNSVFPSFAMMFPKKPQSPEEMELIKNTVNKMKGAENAGKAVAFFANNKEQLPELITVPTNSNDKLFKESSELNTEQICFAHMIDPILTVSYTHLTLPTKRIV